MKAKRAFGDLESREFVIVSSDGCSLFSPPSGRHARYKNKWTTDLQEATVYKTYQAADAAIKRHGLEFAKYTSLKEYKEGVEDLRKNECRSCGTQLTSTGSYAKKEG